MSIDSVKENDNRNYNYRGHSFYQRAEFGLICDLLESGARVIDLGCGNGSLMKFISDRKKVDIQGVEKINSGVDYCLANGLRASIGEIDNEAAYKNYSDNEFDYAICNVTLQMVMYPEVLLNQMRRISRRQIISFPNFAYFGNRLDLLFRGRMPRPMLHRYAWHNTGHIHQLSLKDFYDYCRASGWKIEQARHLGRWKIFANLFFPNFFSKLSVFVLSK